jgi:hypothetical protein
MIGPAALRPIMTSFRFVSFRFVSSTVLTIQYFPLKSLFLGIAVIDWLSIHSCSPAFCDISFRVLFPGAALWQHMACQPIRDIHRPEHPALPYSHGTVSRNSCITAIRPNLFSRQV